eukprot:12292802-Karenia_brevis.AAC.1
MHKLEAPRNRDRATKRPIRPTGRVHPIDSIQKVPEALTRRVVLHTQNSGISRGCPYTSANARSGKRSRGHHTTQSTSPHSSGQRSQPTSRNRVPGGE